MYIAKAGQPIIRAKVPLYAMAAPAAPSMPHAPMCSPAPSVSAHVLFPFSTFFAISGNTASARSAWGGGELLAGVWPVALALALVVTIFLKFAIRTGQACRAKHLSDVAVLAQRLVWRRPLSFTALSRLATSPCMRLLRWIIPQQHVGTCMHALLRHCCRTSNAGQPS